MKTATMEERVAILLNLCGPEVIDSVLKQLDSDQRQRMLKLLSAADAKPPSAAEIDDVLSEFRRAYDSAAGDQSGANTPKLSVLVGDDDDSSHQGAPDGESRRRRPDGSAEKRPTSEDQDQAPKPPEADAAACSLSGDPIADLGRLQAFQVAAALLGESPKTIAIVVNCLEPEKASALLRELPADVGRDVFAQLPRAARSNAAHQTYCASHRRQGQHRAPRSAGRRSR